MSWLRWWVAIWDRRETAEPQALVRILLSLVILVDWIQIGRLGLIVPLFGPEHLGGIGRPLQREAAGLWLYQVLPPEHVAVAAYVGVLVLAVMVGVGLLTRLAAAALLLLMAQLAIAMPGADRGIDMLIRNMLLLLVFAHSHRAWSIDALIWRRASREVPAWPRYLIVMQLVVLYFTAGVQKVSSAWTPFGGYSALYLVMRDPAFATISPDALRAMYPLTQALTAASLLWEWAAPGLLLALFYRDSRERGGRLRSALLRHRFRDVYLGLGIIFHIGTMVSLQLGIFPWAVLALYPACFHPDELSCQVRRAGSLGR